jgi:putative FmdB family regulatory protein
MPYYDYQCEDCGPFTAIRSMAVSGDPCDCPDCGTGAPRAFLRAPNFASMDMSTRTAHATNEKAATNRKWRASSAGTGRAAPAVPARASGQVQGGLPGGRIEDLSVGAALADQPLMRPAIEAG